MTIPILRARLRPIVAQKMLAPALCPCCGKPIDSHFVK